MLDSSAPEYPSSRTQFYLKLLFIITSFLLFVNFPAHARSAPLTVTNIKNIVKNINSETWGIDYSGSVSGKNKPSFTIDNKTHQLIINLHGVKLDSILKHNYRSTFRVSGSVFDKISFVETKTKNQIVLEFVSPIQVVQVPSGNLDSINFTVSYNAVVNIPPIVIGIDPGHGGKDPGAIGRVLHLREKDVTFSIAKHLYNLLNQDPRFTPVLTRTGDYYVPVPERSIIARDKGAQVLISIHADSTQTPNVLGASVWVLSTRRSNTETGRLLEFEDVKDQKLRGVATDVIDGSQSRVVQKSVLSFQFNNQIVKSTSLASDVISELKNLSNLHQKVPQFASLGVLKSPDMPSILIETGFLSNKYDENRLSKEANRKQIANAIYQGLISYYNTHKLQYANTNFTQINIKQQTVAVDKIKKNSSNSGNALVVGSRLYKVHPGDTLISIAKHFGVSYTEIKNTNKLKNDNIRIGQSLKIPLEQNAPFTEVSTTLDFTHTKAYKVKKGDTLTQIANNNNITLADLYTANPDLKPSVSATKPRNIRIGETLQIPTILDQNKDPNQYESESRLVDSGNVYIVQPGDTLTAIAVKNGIGWDDIQTFNHLSSSKIHPGDKLKIPKVVVVQVRVNPNEEEHHHHHEGDEVDFDDGDGTPAFSEHFVNHYATTDNTKINQNVAPASSVVEAIQNTKTANAKTSNSTNGSTTSNRVSNGYNYVSARPQVTLLPDQTYTVRKGDQINQISRRFHIWKFDILNFNHLSSESQVVPGLKLQIPKYSSGELPDKPITLDPSKLSPAPSYLSSSSSKSSSSSSSSNSKPGISYRSDSNGVKLLYSGKTYKVQPHQSIIAISRATHVYVDDILSFNNLHSREQIHAGMVLKIPRYSSGKTPANPVSIPPVKGNSAIDNLDSNRYLGLSPDSTQKAAVSQTPPPSAPAPLNPAPTKYIYYTYESTDSIPVIAQVFKVSVNDLLEANHLERGDSIRIGTKLRIPVQSHSNLKIPHTRILGNSYYYQVQSGDSLGKISNLFNVSIPNLKQANGLTSSNIRIGQSLLIPGYAPQKSTAKPKAPQKFVDKCNLVPYIIKPGESLKGIANRHYMTLDKIMQVNNLSSVDIRAGHSILVCSYR